MVNIIAPRCFFINIAVLQLTVLSQIVFAILPGKNPINYYFCNGTDPKLIATKSPKFNHLPFSSIIFSFFFYTFLCIKVKIFKNKENSAVHVQNNLSNGWTLPPVQNPSNGYTLVNIGSIGVFLTTYYIPLFIAYPFLNNMPFEKQLASYPYFLIIRFLHHGASLVWNLLVIIIFFSKSAVMRRALFRQVLDVWAKIKEKCNISNL